MICPSCKMRWAPFPEGDFKFTKDGFEVLRKGVYEERKKVFDSNVEELCEACKNESEVK